MAEAMVAVQKNAALVQYDPVGDYLFQMSQMLEKIRTAEIWEVVQVLYDAWLQGRRIFICGNGGSAATASHMATDLSKGTIVRGKRRIKAISLTDNVPLMTAWSNDTDYACVFAEQIRSLAEPGDVVIAISASGNSLNVLRAVEVARAFRAVTIGFSGNTGGKLKDLVDICLCMPDEHIGRQEDGHMILDHIITGALRWMIANQKSMGETK